MNKKLICIFLSFCLIFVFAGCNREISNGTESSSSVPSDNISSEISTDSRVLQVRSALPEPSAAATSMPDTSPVILNDQSGIPDTVLYQAVLSALGKSPSDHFTQNEALSLDFLNYGFLKDKIKDIRGIGYLKNLTFLHLADNEITDPSPVTALKKLQNLNLSGNKITNAGSLSVMTWLTKLNLAYNKLTDISPLASLTKLTELGLWYNQITDITPLLSLRSLTVLSLESNQIDMSNQANSSAVETFQKRVTYFSLGLQGFQNGGKYNSVKLYIDRQQTYDSFSNIKYVDNGLTLNGEPIKFYTLYQITTPGTYNLHAFDNLGTEYKFSFTIIAS